jgi:hypothetical protein
MTALAPTLQAYFTDRLMSQRAASSNTIAAYRTSLRLLICYAADKIGKKPSQLDLADLDAPLVVAFLRHLELDRRNSARTRNNRLAAIHSLFAYAALRHPEHATSIQRVLAIPPKRHENTLLTYLADDEVDALLAACDRATRTGRRDHAMLTLAVQTGLRSLRTGPTHLRGCRSRHRRQRAHPGQGTQRTQNTARGRHRRGSALLAHRVRRHRHRTAVSDQHRQPSQPRRHRTSDRPLREHRRRTLHAVTRKARDCPHSQTHLPCVYCCKASTSP